MLTALRRLTTSRTDTTVANNSSGTPPPGLHAMSSSLQKKFSKGVQYNMKIVLKGDRNCGKSSLFRRLQGLNFSDEYLPTDEIQVANINWNYKTTNDIVKVEIWDVVDKAKRKKCTLGKLKMENPREDVQDVAEEMALDASFVNVYKNSNGVIFIFDSTKNWTFEYVKRELPNVPNRIPVLILSNRRDSNDRAITTETVQCFIESLKEKESYGEIVYSESSMRNGFGLKFVHKFFNLPFLQLQRETLMKQLETNKSENLLTLDELNVYAESDDANYNIFIDGLRQKLSHNFQPAKNVETIGQNSKYSESSDTVNSGNDQVQLNVIRDVKNTQEKQSGVEPCGECIPFGLEDNIRATSIPGNNRVNNLKLSVSPSLKVETEGKDILDFIPEIETVADKNFLSDEQINLNTFKVENSNRESQVSSDDDDYLPGGNPMVMSMVEDVLPSNYSGSSNISRTPNRELFSSVEDLDFVELDTSNTKSLRSANQSDSVVTNNTAAIGHRSEQVEPLQLQRSKTLNTFNTRESKEKKNRRKKGARAESYDAFVGGTGQIIQDFTVDLSAYEVL